MIAWGTRGFASALAIALIMSACSTRTSDEAPGEPAVGELSAHGGQVCPDRLPEPPEGVSDAWMLADLVPALGSFDSAWLCQFVGDNLQDTVPGSGTALSWVRQGEPSKFPESGTQAITTMLSSLELYTTDVICTADLGPRWMVVLVDGDDLTGVAIDDFGCRMVLLTEDPFVTATGHSTDPLLVQGALDPGPGIIEAIKAAAGLA